MKLIRSMLLRWYLALQSRETVVVHLKSGSSIRGVLVATHRDALMLRHASALSAAGSISVDGEAEIPRVNVDWIQRLPEVAA
jgi:hypothetical protein